MVGRAAWWPTFRKWTIWKAIKAGHNCNVYGHLPKEEVESVQKRLLRTSGEDGSGKRIVSGISNLFEKPSEAPTKHQSVVHHSSKQPPTENKQKSKKQQVGAVPRKGAFLLCCCESLRRLTSRRWRRRKALPTLERLLEPRGEPIFQIDFTKDFSGTLDRKALMDHLHKSRSFAFQDCVFPETRGTILDNAANVGEHVCTWMQIESGYTTGVKLYTKVVSQFEAGEVQDPFEGHLADYVFSTDKHLRKLLHTDTCKKEIVLE